MAVLMHLPGIAPKLIALGLLAWAQHHTDIRGAVLAPSTPTRVPLGCFPPILVLVRHRQLEGQDSYLIQGPFSSIFVVFTKGEAPIVPQLFFLPTKWRWPRIGKLRECMETALLL